MIFQYKMPTKICFGRGCLENNWGEAAKQGKRFLIITGPSSGRLSGALDDVILLLKRDEFVFDIFDKVENNPSLENIAEASIRSRKFGTDAIIAIGGGSPLDAAKAVAVMTVNDMEPVDLYKNVFPERPLPVIAIPTTAGTGSEVTQYSILTRRDIGTKKSFGNEAIFPRIAYLDPSYTESMPYRVTVDTAMDAFTHALEGYTSRRSTPLSELYAVESMRLFGECLKCLLDGDNVPDSVREKLLYMSMLGGMVITQTGTTLIHGLGYPLTYFRNIPHGRANGLFVEQYLRFNYPACKEKVERVLGLIGCNDMDDIGEIFKKLTNTRIRLSEDDIEMYADTAYRKKSTSYNLAKVEKEDLKNMLRAVTGGENTE